MTNLEAKEYMKAIHKNSLERRMVDDGNANDVAKYIVYKSHIKSCENWIDGFVTILYFYRDGDWHETRRKQFETITAAKQFGEQKIESMLNYAKRRNLI